MKWLTRQGLAFLCAWACVIVSALEVRTAMMHLSHENLTATQLLESYPLARCAPYVSTGVLTPFHPHAEFGCAEFGQAWRVASSRQRLGRCVDYYVRKDE